MSLARRCVPNAVLPWRSTMSRPVIVGPLGSVARRVCRPRTPAVRLGEWYIRRSAMPQISQVGWMASCVWRPRRLVFASCSLHPAAGPQGLLSQSGNEPVARSPAPPIAAGSPTCNTLFNTATWTYSTSHPTLTPPAPQGGAFVDGIYECTALDTCSAGRVQSKGFATPSSSPIRERHSCRPTMPSTGTRT